MITFRHTEGVFTFRAVGVLVHGDNVLLQTTDHDPFWVLPGGRVEFGEDAAAAAVREIREELLVDAQVERLLWVVENFFEYNGNQCHGLELYFLLSLEPDCELCGRTEQWTGMEGGYTLYFQWFPVSALAEVELYPTFLKQALLALPERPAHVVQRRTGGS